MWGTDGADAVKGSPTEGDGYINGMNGDDVIYGTDRDKVLYNEIGDALFVAGGGTDIIYAGAGNDILDGGAGADTLYGEAGNDTYIFRRGSGQDTLRRKISVFAVEARISGIEEIRFTGDVVWSPDYIKQNVSSSSPVFEIQPGSLGLCSPRL
jgi:Ca2+-binding RTX toxin-like protein